MELLPILGYRTAGDRVAPLTEELSQSLIGVGGTLVLALDELGEHLLDLSGGDEHPFAEEVLEHIDPEVCLYRLAVAHSGDGTDVEPCRLGYIPEDHRAQIRDLPREEEGSLMSDDSSHGRAQGVLALLEGIDEPPCLLDLVLEELKDRGFIVGKNGIGRNVMAFQPPLVITEDNVNDVLNALELTLTEKGF